MSTEMKNQQKLLDVVASISVVCAHLEVVVPICNTGISKHAYLGNWIKVIVFSTEDQVVTSFPPWVMACGYDGEVHNLQPWAIDSCLWHLATEWQHGCEVFLPWSGWIGCLFQQSHFDDEHQLH